MYGNGGILCGVAPTRTGAPGVWRLGEIANARASQIWPTEKDPYFSNVALLEHFNGPTGLQSFQHRGNSTFGVVQQSTASTSTPILAVGSSAIWKTSAEFTQSNYAKCEPYAIAAFAFGSGDWTVEFWVYPTSIANSPDLLDMRNNGSNGAFVRILVTSTGVIKLYVSSADRITSAAGAIVTNQWQFIACSRVSGTTRLFVDGTQVGSDWTDATSYGNASCAIMASASAGNRCNGYVNDVRITKGTGRYSSNFTRPAEPFPDY